MVSVREYPGKIDSDTWGRGSVAIGGEGREVLEAKTQSVSKYSRIQLLMGLMLLSMHGRGRYSARDMYQSLIDALR